MVNRSERRVREEARQRDHKQLYDLLASFLTGFEERYHSGRSMVSDPLASFPLRLVSQVGHVF